MPALKDLTGQRFGRLVVINRDTSRKGVYWNCQCDCGNTTSVRSNSLTMGKTKSCGCYWSETRISSGQKGGANGYNDLTNKSFGDLIALYPLTDQRASNGSLIWHCKCSCGNEINVNSGNLLRGRTSHCGCKSIVSKGEEKITLLLTQAGIPFERQKIFATCKFDTNYPARFDFFVNNNYIIEFDGEQHFNANGERFDAAIVQEIKQHDIIKNTWCKQNNIPLIRIPYYHYNDLQLTDLLIETSSYII
jgi:hypothetical protein